MRTFRILKINEKFSKKEINLFKKYLRSPYLVSDKSLIRTYEALLPFLRYKKQLNISEVISRIAASLNYSYKTVVNNLTDIGEAALNFIKSNESAKDSIAGDLIISRWLMENQMERLYKASQKKINIKLNHLIRNKSMLTYDTFLMSYKNYITRIEHYILSQKFENEGLKSSFVNLLNLSVENLYIYFILETTSIYANYIFNLTNQNGVSLEKFFLKSGHIKKIIENNNMPFSSELNKDVYSLFRQLYFLISDLGNIDNYLRYKNTVINFGKKGMNDVSLYHLNILINFCTMMTRLGYRADYFKNESLTSRRIYFQMVYLNNNSKVNMAAAEYRNYVIDCANSGNSVYLKDFIYKCTEMLPEKNREKMQYFALAVYYMGIKNYRKANDCISFLSNNKFIYKFDVSHLKIKQYYERGEKERLQDEIEYYYRQLKREKSLTVYDRKNYLKPVEFFWKLFSLKFVNRYKNSSLKAKALLKQINEKNETFVMKTWIVDKLNEIAALSDFKTSDNYLTKAN